MKLKKEDIINICLDREKGYGCRSLSKKYNLNTEHIRNLVNRYKMHGIESLFHKVKSRNYTVEFKESICKRIMDGESQSALAVEVGVNRGTVWQWFNKYEQMGYNGLKDKRGRPGVIKMGKKKKIDNQLDDAERLELNELRIKTRRLEMELEASKKLEALVQERIKRESRKK